MIKKFLIRSRLADLLLHFAYDRVYATNEQRVAGSGTLNLVYYVAAELGLEEGDISGTWDVSHQLQIIWHKVLKNNQTLD